MVWTSIWRLNSFIESSQELKSILKSLKIDVIRQDNFHQK